MIPQDSSITDLFSEAQSLYRRVRQPEAGVISDAAEVSAFGSSIVFAGTLVGALNGTPPTRVCLMDRSTADTRVLTFGPNTDRSPKFSPDGRHVAFLSDRHRAGDFQLHLLDPMTGMARPTNPVRGWVEYLHWSPDGTRILLGVAGHGADVSGGQGAVTSKTADVASPSWMPRVQSGDESYLWRQAWLYELRSGRVHCVSPEGCNVWEAVWCGNNAFAAVVSPGPSEGLWYTARLEVIQIESGRRRELLAPRDQLGWPAASPSGRFLAVVEGLCSDRWIVAGDLRLIDTVSGVVRSVDTRAVDITYTEWRSERALLLAGHRGFDTVVALFDAPTGTFTEVWCSRTLTTAGRYVSVAGLNESGDCVLVGEDFVTAPQIAEIRDGKYRTIRSFDCGYAAEAECIGAAEEVIWPAPDGLPIQGWLVRPRGTEPHPLILHIHGGPVWHWRPRWLGRAGVHLLMLLQRGYAIFFPNPRGSGGRGQDFARHVLGDMGGADTYDYLAGLDHLVERGIADPTRLGVTGASYGGFMSAWLITQDARFAAAVPVAPVANHVTEHLISNIPHFVSLFLDDRFSNPGGKYFERSPIMHAHKARTPTLNICGALDRCTPPEEAMQFHSALLEHGVCSVLVTYPEEGHGVSQLPAVFDFSARVVAWFEQHMPADASRTPA